MGDVLETLAQRYGPIDDLSLDRLRLKQARNRLRRDAIDEEVSDLVAERRRLEGEWERMELARSVLVDELADQIRQRHGEGWSPVPVVGYRLWGIDASGRLVGATGRPWPKPSMVAECGRAQDGADLPHTAIRCSDVGHGCGIYAAIRPNDVDPGTAVGWVVGTVLLTGKVVQHEHGYRAQRARVAVVAAHAFDRLLVTDDAKLIDRLFARPAETLRREGTGRPTPLSRDEMVSVSKRLERSMEWT